MKIVGHVVFSCDLDGAFPDPGGAAGALEKVGYVVARYPEQSRYRLAVAGDDFLEAVLDIGEADNKVLEDAIYREILDIVRGFGGWVEEIGFEPADYVPFSDADYVADRMSR